MSTINKSLPIFKNIHQKYIDESSGYENINPQLDLSKYVVHSSKFKNFFYP